MSNKINKRTIRRARRTRAGLAKAKNRPRLSVFRSNKSFYAQIIDDLKGITLAATGSNKVKEAKGLKKTEVAEKVGEHLAKIAKDRKIEKVKFDKGSYKYHGRVKAFAEAARKGGLDF